jgi:predicted RNase H-like HicB family nuclease
MARAFHVIVERDEDGWYVGTVSELPGCHTQAKSLDQLRTRVHEAIRAYIGPRKSVPKGIEFVGVVNPEQHLRLGHRPLLSN